MNVALKRLMNRTNILFGILLLYSIGWFYVPQLAFADVEWTFVKQRNLDATPLDITTSSDGQWIYILTPGEILICSMEDDKVMSRIPVDKTIDRISYTTQTNTLVISSSTAKTIKQIHLEIIQKFAFDGLAFKGLENAPVTIAIFSDYQ